MKYNYVAVTMLIAAGAASARAQGTVSAQSLGYPPGQLSTRSIGTAGALGDIDGHSPINPAALAIRAAAQVFAQYDPEFRTVTNGGATSSTLTARFPNIGAVLPVNGNLVVGIGASTLLDRTWSTRRTAPQVLDNVTVQATEALKSDGGITDLRLAAGYAFGPRFRIGLGAHGFTGSTRVTTTNTFSDTLRFRDINQVTNLSYSGTAISGGLEVDVLPSVGIAMSGQKGGTAKMFAGDTVLSTANIPDRYSGSISFSGLPGTLIAVRAAREMWSQIGALSTFKSAAVDATEVSAGLESAGPRIGGFPILVRLGARHRTLPFPVGTSTVTETSFGGGLGIPIAFDRVTFDMAALRTSRSGVAGITEHAYNLSFGLQVHP